MYELFIKPVIFSWNELIQKSQLSNFILYNPGFIWFLSSDRCRWQGSVGCILEILVWYLLFLDQSLLFFLVRNHRYERKFRYGQPKTSIIFVCCCCCLQDGMICTVLVEISILLLKALLSHIDILVSAFWNRPFQYLQVLTCKLFENLLGCIWIWGDEWFRVLRGQSE